MGPAEIIIIVVIAIALAAIGWLLVRPRKALPPSEPREALEPGKTEAEKAEPEPEIEQPQAVEAEKPEPEAEQPKAVEPEQPEAEGEKAEPEPPEAEAEGEKAEPEPAAPEKAEKAEPEQPEAEGETAEPEQPKAPAFPRFAPPPTFAPPPSIGKVTKVEPPKVEPPKVEPPKVAPPVEAAKPEPAPEPAPEPKLEPAPEQKAEPAPEQKLEPAPEQKLEPAPEPETRAPVPMPVDKPKLAAREAREQAELEAKKSERDRYRAGLQKTKRGFIAKLARLFKGKPKVSDDLKDEIEEVLFTADIGAKSATALLESVTEELDKKDVADPDAVWTVIRQKALDILDIDAPALNFEPEHGPYTLLMIGVNGVGKTTTIGKLAARHVAAGRKTLMVAGDTFRAAAGEQLEVWARRVGCDIHLGKDGADPSAVLFDGITRGREQGYDVILCDTAGRLHTRKELMDELGKMGRAATKALSKGRGEVEPHDIFLVLDATIGQNALAQAQMFKETMSFSGLVLTKLDGTAKGGVVLGVVDELRVPIRYIGIGEAVDDLRSFDPEAFCDVLFRPDVADANEGD